VKQKAIYVDYSPNAGSKAHDPPALLRASDQTCLIDLNKKASTCPESIPPHKIAASKRERDTIPVKNFPPDFQRVLMLVVIF
jgi:hypothetical protein